LHRGKVVGQSEPVMQKVNPHTSLKSSPDQRGWVVQL